MKSVEQGGVVNFNELRADKLIEYITYIEHYDDNNFYLDLYEIEINKLDESQLLIFIESLLNNRSIILGKLYVINNICL